MVFNVGEVWELQLKLLKAKQSDLVGMPKPKDKDLELLLAEVRKIEGAQLGLVDFVYNRSTGIAIKSDEVCFVA